MKKVLLYGLVIGLMFALAKKTFAASGDQLIKLNSADVTATVTTTISNIPAVAQSGVWNINATITSTPENVDIRDLLSTQDSVSAVQSGDWQVSIVGTPSIRYLSPVTDGIKIFGDQGIALKTDATGQIYAITSPESGTNIRKTYTFLNIAVGTWVEVGSYTVTAGKTFKIYNAKATGRFALDFKISDGNSGQDIYLATSPANGSDSINIDRPIPIPAGTTIRVFAKTDEPSNDGTVLFGGFEF